MDRLYSRSTFHVVAVVLFALAIAACSRPLMEPRTSVETVLETAPASGDGQPSETVVETEPTTSRITEAAPAIPTASVTPAEEPVVLNPLTGEPVEDAGDLAVRPLLVSVSNFPVSARPQAGLSLATQVWETFIGDGMTRFLAVFYGDYARNLQAILENPLVEGSQDGFVIGPVRSGRVVFEDIKALFEGAALITAGASPDVAEQLTSRVSVYGDDDGNINSTGVEVGDLSRVGEMTVDPSRYATLSFDETAPEGGEPADFFRIVYNYYNQIGWDYAPELGAYLRSQDTADGTGELVPAVERLTGEQLAFDNVLVLWAQHRYVTPTILEMQLVYVWDQRGLLFRDGRMYPVLWSSRSGRFMVYDEDGQVVPLNPGSTFVQVVSWQSTWNPDTMVVRYHNPPLP